MSRYAQRNLIRTIHLVGAASIGTYVYSPWSDVAWFALFNQALVIPVLSLTGLWMWKGQKFFRSRHD